MLSTLAVLAAVTGGIDLSSVKALVQSLADGLSTLIRTAAIAIVVGGLAKVIATALAGTTGSTGP
jgi:hypothetical protein